MKFKNRLYNMLNDVRQHHRDRNDVMKLSVEDRLSKALSSYSKEIAESYNYLSYRGSLRVMSKLNKRK